MLIEQAILTALKADSTLTALTGSRIYYVIAPQIVTTPYLVFFKVSGVRVSSHDGGSGLVDARFQFSCFGETYKACKDMTVAIQGLLEGFSGTLGGTGGVVVGGCYYLDEQDFYEGDSKLYHVAVDYRFWHNE